MAEASTSSGAGPSSTPYFRLQEASKKRFPEAWKTIQETNVFIRESQKARAYSFPHAFAPNGKLQSEEVHNYMEVMKQYYEYNSRDQDLILELKELGEDNEVRQIWKVGEVYSADFYWTEYETIRLHLIAVRPYYNHCVEHYHVFDLGSAGNAYTIPMHAWDNWRIWAHDKAEGIHIDKRIIYMAIGDRSQIENMSLEEFSNLTCDEVEALQDKLTPGMHLVRPSIEEACLHEIPETKTSPPVVDLLSSSSGSDNGRKEEKQEEAEEQKWGFRGNELKARNKARRSRDPRQTGGRMKGGKKGGRGAKTPRIATFPLRPNGLPYPTEVLEKMTKLFTECVTGVSPPRSFPVLLSPTLDETSQSIQSVPDSSDGDTSNGDYRKRDSSYDNVSGIEYLDDSTGPLPRQDSVEVFLAKMANESQIVNISTSTDGSMQADTRGQTSDGAEMEV